MRVTRAKFIRKYLRFYKIVFDISDPYHIILDGNFIYTALKYKIDITDRFRTLLQNASSIKYYILLSSVNELKAVGDKVKNTLEYIKQLCSIIDDEHININAFRKKSTDVVVDTPALRMRIYLDNAHKEWIANPSNKSTIHYFVATQDKQLRRDLAHIPGTPLIYLNKVTLLLEPLSDASKDFSKSIEVQKLNTNTQENDIISNLSSKSKSNRNIIGTSSTIAINRYEVKRKAKGINPLASAAPSKSSSKSMKKKTEKYKRN